MREFSIGDVKIGGGQIVLFGGPCVIETEEHLISVGKKIKEITSRLNMPFILKSSFDKANRTSIGSYRGPGADKGLEILACAKNELDVPLLTDVHEIEQVDRASRVADVLQIPAFLSRQTDLICAAAKTGKAINVKKGQFLAPWDMAEVVKKIESCGNQKIILTERGASFGYNNLVVDMRALPIMRELGYPVMFDATHSVQLPGGQGGCSGGQREYVSHLARAAAGVGIDALFIEIHDNPDKAPCDGPNMLHINDLEKLLKDVMAINEIARR